MQARKNTILAELFRHLPSGRRRWMLGALMGTSLLSVVAATAVVPGDALPPFPVQSVIEQLGSVTVQPSASTPIPFVFDERVQPGDTIQTLFRRLKIDDQEALDFLSGDPESRSALRQLRAGRSVLALVDGRGKLVSLTLPVARGDSSFTIEGTPEGIRSRSQAHPEVDTHIEMRAGTIRHTLFGATDSAGVPDSVATKLAEIFGTEVDFSSDLRAGDQFSVVYETIYDKGAPAGSGRVLAAEFVNQGKKYAVVLHRDADGSEAYYTPEGRGLNEAYLRYPLEFSRISSTFGRRLHPIHRSWRSHNGVDFAAPTGTPVKAASDGVVNYVGRQNGYGNIVVLQHRDRYSTAYAHLHGFAGGLRKGAKIRQGDLIGYVGSTGWATGPHLHYEIRVNNVAHDPMKIALPTVQPLGPTALAAFKSQTAPLLQRLALLNRTVVAQAD
ncbi:M23 family metallopeptidase [Aromatoleum buckelii]|uniref:Peptidoglycan DD-metalloendopeptidase family protein n=2 Tax=Aromatoleum buckelii TaxID=200254 RepID=A0ABX1MX75_9RHOO|nr:M23 family metallopeptidase [Aromatoleum buckelii]MCK0512213.1 M23 family metallopeptidase [Aromatoleum buckelii]